MILYQYVLQFSEFLFSISNSIFVLLSHSVIWPNSPVTFSNFSVANFVLLTNNHEVTANSNFISSFLRSCLHLWQCVEPQFKSSFQTVRRSLATEHKAKKDSFQSYQVVAERLSLTAWPLRFSTKRPQIQAGRGIGNHSCIILTGSRGATLGSPKEAARQMGSPG